DHRDLDRALVAHGGSPAPKNLGRFPARRMDLVAVSISRSWHRKMGPVSPTITPPSPPGPARALPIGAKPPAPPGRTNRSGAGSRGPPSGARCAVSLLTRAAGTPTPEVRVDAPVRRVRDADDKRPPVRPLLGQDVPRQPDVRLTNPLDHVREVGVILAV